MSLIEIFKEELDKEAAITRKMLSRVPDNKFTWKPHPKSMEMKALVTHIAELPSWVKMTLTTDELDFEQSGYKPSPVSSTQDLLDLHEQSVKAAKEYLDKASEAELEKPWTLRSGKTIFSTDPKREVIRMAYNQITHHRAQLGVYLRLLDIPIPGSYGPSADEPWDM